MRYTDNLTPSHLKTPPRPKTFSEPTIFVPGCGAKPQPQPTMLDIANQLIRMETRLVKLMYHVGLDANGKIREEH